MFWSTESGAVDDVGIFSIMLAPVFFPTAALFVAFALPSPEFFGANFDPIDLRAYTALLA